MNISLFLIVALIYKDWNKKSLLDAGFNIVEISLINSFYK